ncbi:single-stranded DNA-binding protein [Nocardioides mesophilus]|uniref:Single-stranded DNA-binding protein n=1 Tax=Nocardioides mesophilus TaxID=433659 RepID=A0A7G9RCU8_9ACTN|nr:single-stranded DNA-binding protein [Nocardioides mesophilus]QNN53423.1 single-stranded DNA-binding protein [Nocardioides mesophilus]
MSDTYVTLHGWVGSEVTFRDPNGISVVNLRVASTPRLKKDGKWVDGETTWYSVTAWRSLADNVRGSVKKGDAVIVHGRLRTEVWTREDGQPSSTLQIEASLVGHDLTRGTSIFLRTPKPERADTDVEQEVDQMIREVPDDLGPVDSWGNPREDQSSVEEPAA